MWHGSLSEGQMFNHMTQQLKKPSTTPWIGKLYGCKLILAFNMPSKIWFEFSGIIIVVFEEQFVVFADIGNHTGLTNTGPLATCNSSRTWNQRKVKEIHCKECKWNVWQHHNYWECFPILRSSNLLIFVSLVAKIFLKGCKKKCFLTASKKFRSNNIISAIFELCDR